LCFHFFCHPIRLIPPQGGHNLARLLIVEDEPHMRQLMGMHLRADGHTLVSVATVKEGLATLETQEFDAIVTVSPTEKVSRS
jgi:DNA-binding NtrC family response regulator